MNTSFEDWELAVQIAMAGHGIDHIAAEPLIEEVKAHCAQSGETPWDAFGSPEEFAEAAAAEQPASVRSRRDRHGNTPGEYVSGALLGLAIQTVLVSLAVAVVNTSLSIHLTVAGLVGSLVLGLIAFVSVAAPGALRAAGHPRLAVWSYAVVAVLAVGAAGAFIELPRTRLVTVPILLFTAIGVLGTWLATKLLARSQRTIPSLGARSTPAEADHAALAANSDDDHQWFERLHGLLVGRFDVPKQRAAQFVVEARSHLVATRTSPGEEFGPVAVYAMNLAAGEQQRQGPWWRSSSAELALLAMLAVWSLLSSLQYWNDGREWIAAAAGLFALSLALSAVQLAQRQVRRRRT